MEGRSERTTESMSLPTPTAILDSVWREWATGDVFFRGFSENMMSDISKHELVLFRHPDMKKHVFGYPASQTPILQRLKLNTSCIHARLMLMAVLDRCGFEFLGQEKIHFTNLGEFGQPNPITLHQSALKWPIVELKHMEFNTPRGLVLVPRTNLIQD